MKPRQGVLQRSNHKKKIILRIIFALLLILLICIVWFWKDIWGLRNWDGRRRFNIVLDMNPIVIISIAPDENEAAVVAIPPDTYLAVPYGYGYYKAGSVYRLGALDKKRGGGPLLSDTLQYVFGLPIDGYIHYDVNGAYHLENKSQFISFKLQFFNLFGGVGIPATNLGLAEYIRFIKNVSHLRSDQYRFFNIENSNILISAKLPDGSTIGRIDSDRLDQVLEGVFNEKRILDEKATISIYNGSSSKGIANSIGRIINNMGSRVVVIGNNEKKISESCILHLNPVFNNSYTKERLIQIFGCIADNKYDSYKLSDIAFVIGEGFIK